MTADRWIIGRGLLGNALARTDSSEPFRVAVPWPDPDATTAALRDGLSAFLQSVSGPVEIYWCAGRGVTSTPADELEREVSVFRRFLADVERSSARDRTRLSMFLASSVGGAYGGSSHPPFTEFSPPVPASAYGHAKIQMEEELRDATARGGWRSLVGRITNLYGPGQDMAKGQGLISAVVRSFVTERPVSIFVPLDTLRDYIYEDDCAAVIVAGMHRLQNEDRGTTVMKIVSGMNAMSVSAILAEHNRLRRRRSPIILGGAGGAGQALDLRVRSMVWTDLNRHVRTTLCEGLDAVFRAQLSTWGNRG